MCQEPTFTDRVPLYGKVGHSFELPFQRQPSMPAAGLHTSDNPSASLTYRQLFGDDCGLSGAT